MSSDDEERRMGSPVTVTVIIILTMFMAFITAAVVRLNLEPITNSSIIEKIEKNEKILIEIREELRNVQAKTQ